MNSVGAGVTEILQLRDVSCQPQHTREHLLREPHPAELLIERDETLISEPDLEAFGMRCLFMVAEDDAWCLCMWHWVHFRNDLK